MLIALLILQANPLESALAKPNHVKKLSLARQELQSLPPEVGKLKKLQELDLSYNPIEALPNELGDLAQLESLSLRCTKLKKLPDSFVQLTKLKRLDLSSAMDCEDVFRMSPQVAAILGKLPNLVELRIAFMHIKTPPAEVATLTKLRLLDLSFNELTTPPKTLPPDLIELDLSGNELQALPELGKKLIRLGISGQRGKKPIPPEQIEALTKANPKLKVIAD